MKKNIIFLFVAALMNTGGFAQGFINLNFEAANVSAYGAEPAVVPATNAIPGWTAYINGFEQNQIAFNSIALSNAAESLHGTNSSMTPLQGKYSVLLQSGNFDSQNGNYAAIGQTGQIPLSALSLLFWGNDLTGWKITFAGQVLVFSAVSSTANYTVYGANISAYAGQTGELLFSAIQYPNPFGSFPPTSQAYGLIDNIQFSSTAVPEPSALALAVLGATLLIGRRKKLPLP